MWFAIDLSKTPTERVFSACLICDSWGRIDRRKSAIREKEVMGRMAARQSGLAPKRTLTTAEIVADPAITLGGCRVETRFGIIDQQFEAQLKRIEEELT